MNYNFGDLTYAKILMVSAFAIMFFCTSCSSSKKIAYFQDVSDTLNKPVVKEQQKFNPPLIKVDDLLTVSVSTIDAAAQGSNTATHGGGASGGSGGGAMVSSQPTYLVDKNGNIDLPIVGRINVVNKTTSDVKEVIYERAKKYYVNPIVNVSFANFHITVLGDVFRPGTYTTANEKVTLFDAIGLAGDIQITGKKENVLLVREDGNNKEFVRLNLNSSDIVTSPYYYIHSGDVIYIEPIAAKVNANTVDNTKTRFVSYAISGVTLLVSLINIYIQINRNK